MAWIAKVTAYDYVAQFRPGGLVVVNRRTDELFRLSNEDQAAISHRFGMAVSSKAVIDYCIERAIIPHPVEEYV